MFKMYKQFTRYFVHLLILKHILFYSVKMMYNKNYKYNILIKRYQNYICFKT